MKKLDIFANVTRTFYKTSLQLKKHSPEILIVTGAVGVVAGAIMACKATTKLSTVLEETKDTVDKVHELAENPDMAEKYTEEDSKKDLAIIYTQSALKIAKLYAPAVIVGAASLACMLTSHHILRKRNIALAAAYATLDKNFRQYSGRLIDRFGKELDRELRYGIKAKEIEETVVQEDGTETTVKKTVATMDPNGYSGYAIVFEPGNTGWDPEPAKTKYFLVQQQNHANELLQSRGYLFLNEVYEMLGAPITSFGQCVGWIYDEAKPVGDNFVDFGMFNIHNEKAVDFMNGHEQSIVLDFNVDGNILDMI